ncbi:MAG: DUF3943 domain-containing protein [Chitinispirillaceae bacterium]|jgi:hypothetical protein
MNSKRIVSDILFLWLSFSAVLQAQDTLGLEKQTIRLTTISDLLVSNSSNKLHSDDPLTIRTKNLPKDALELNKKYPLWIPLVDVVGINAVINLFDRYVLNTDYVRISLHSWGNNFRAGWPWGPGWKWDSDAFGNNFLFHPISGNFYYNAARSNGYNFYEALPITFFGGYMWKIFGENGKPEREDLISTTISGVFIGEVTYRLSSVILDDRAIGTERVFREIGAGLIDPVRAINRLLQGKTSRTTAKEVDQKEPLKIRLSTGTYLENRDAQFGTGDVSGIVDIRLDYGDPFEDRTRKPYDFFKVRTQLDLEKGRVVLNIASGYGLLYGKNAYPRKLDILAGAFQHWDYYDDTYFELTAAGFGPGLISRIQLPSNSEFRVDLHVAGVPFGANTTRLGPYSVATRDYDFVGGMEAKLESALDLCDRVRATFKGSFFLTHTYVGNARDNYSKSNDKFTIVNPGIAFRLYRNLGIGFEHVVYSSNRDPDIYYNTNFKRSEQKLYLTYYSGTDHRRK